MLTEQIFKYSVFAFYRLKLTDEISRNRKYRMSNRALFSITIVTGLGCRLIYANVLYLLVTSPIVIFAKKEVCKLTRCVKQAVRLCLVSDI